MKKKAIKIATASAIAASGFVAVAPTQSEAAPNVKAEVSRAKTVMYNAMYAYSKPFVATGEMVDQAVVYAAYKKGEAQYKYAVSVVNKYAPAKEKAALLADLDKVRKNYLLGRALNYIKAFNALELHVEKAAKELEAALATNDEAKIKEAKANLEKVYEAQKADLNKAVESSIKAHVNELAATVVETAKAAAEKKLEEIAKNAVPKVESVSAINLKQVVVTFNSEVDATTAGTTGNYTFASGSGISVTNASVDGKVVTLTVSGATQQQTSDLTVENVKTEAGDVIGKVTKSVKFVDTVAPTVSSVEAVGPRTVRVKFSEPLSQAPTFSLNEGQISIVSTAFNAGDSEATLTLGTAPTAGNYSLKVKDGLDYAGFKIDEVTKEFNFAVDTTAPVLTVKSASPTRIVLSSNEDLTGVLDNNVEFFHTYNGVAAYKASKSVNGKEITLDFNNPLPEGAFKLFLNYASDNGTQIADLWGNKVAEQTISGTVVADTTAPTVTKVEAPSNTAIEVTFSEAVSGATTAANYEIKDAAGNTVAVNGSITNPSGNTYRIPVAALNGGSYTITVKNIKDTSINQNKIADFTATVAVKDVVAPTVSDLDTNANGTQAQLLSTKKVKIVFSEVMDKASIENKLNYLFGGNTALDSKVTVTAVDGNKAVILDFTDVASGAQTTPASATIDVLRVVDAAGNPTALASTTVSVPAQVSAPLFDKADVTGKNTIKLYFKETITNAQAADFLVGVAGANGAFAAAGSISNEVVEGKSVITLTTSQDLPTTAANVVVKTANTVSAKNSYGSYVSLPATAANDKYAPLATIATAIDNDNDTFVDRFTVQFSENLYVASVQDSDFTVEGYEVTGVSVNNDTVTLTVKEKTTADLSATPKVTLVGSVEDTARNVRSSQDALTAVAAQAGLDATTVATAKAALAPTVTNATAATSTVTLPATQSGATVTWTSSVANTISNGVFTTPARGAQPQVITLTATITKGAATDTKTFTVTVGNNTDTDGDGTFDNATTIQ